MVRKPFKLTSIAFSQTHTLEARSLAARHPSG